MTSRMPLITCYAKLNYHFSDIRSLLPRRDTYVFIDIDHITMRLYQYIYNMRFVTKYKYLTSFLSSINIIDIYLYN